MATQKASKKVARKRTSKSTTNTTRRRFQKSLYREENVPMLVALRLLRERAGLTQLQLSQHLGRSQNYVFTLESGTSRADGVQIYDWCMACGSSLSAWAKLVERELKLRDFPV